MLSFFFFFFNDTATTEIYTLSLHDALPISLSPSFNLAQKFTFHPNDQPVASSPRASNVTLVASANSGVLNGEICRPDRKSTRLNSSHVRISYAVFCLKKKNKKKLYNNQQHK